MIFYQSIVRRLVNRQIDDELQHTVVDDKNNKMMLLPRAQ